MYDVVIIGAGVIGCALARELARLEGRIAVVDRASDVCEGASKANSGIVHAGFDAEPGTAKARYNVRGNPLLAQWARELQVPYRNNTSLVLALAPDELPGLDILNQRGQQNGVSGLRLLSGEAVRAREPQVNPAVAGALLAETGGIVSPYHLTIALAEQAAINGVEFWLNCDVTRVSKHPAGHFCLDTSRGYLESRSLVNAAGVFADTINTFLSEDTFTITARRGEYWMLDKQVGAQFQTTLFQLPTAQGKGVLVTPTVEQTLILGPTSEWSADKQDTRTTAEKLSEIRRVAGRTCPDLPFDQAITSFSGLRAHCDRGDFILGRAVDVPGYYLAAGIESPGLTAAPAIAVDLAQLIAADFVLPAKTIFLPPPPPIQPPGHELATWIARDPAFGRLVCRCEQVSEGVIRAAIRRPLGARTLDAVKRRTRAQMGRCQGGFCTPRILEILAEELAVPETALTKFGGRSWLLAGRVGSLPTSASGEGGAC